MYYIYNDKVHKHFIIHAVYYAYSSYDMLFEEQKKMMSIVKELQKHNSLWQGHT
jgi:hypothetical protein